MGTPAAGGAGAIVMGDFSREGWGGRSDRVVWGELVTWVRGHGCFFSDLVSLFFIGKVGIGRKEALVEPSRRQIPFNSRDTRALLHVT